MSNPDSFIEEVTEEVRRDRLFAMFRKYGWIGGLLVVAIVGGAAYSEWQKAQALARAEGFGEAMLDALDIGGASERRAAMGSVPADGAQLALRALMVASDPAEDKAAALAALDALIADVTQPEIYRDMAQLRRVMVAGTDMALADRRAALEGISAPGRAFRVMAAEQLAYLMLEEGNTEAAIAALATLMQDQEATQGLRARAAQMITALGGSLPETAEAAPDQG
ncbi:hypothetical protein MCEREM30_01957 [Paracoccaceae bacterium]